MFDFANNPDFANFLHGLITDVNLPNILVWTIISVIISMIGGAVGGMILAGKEIGYKLSATVGSLFAPAGVIPALILGLLIVSFIR